MSPMLNDAVDRTKNFWSSITLSQRVFIGGLALTVLGVFFALLFWLNKPDMQLLYSNLALEDANRIVKVLQAEKVPYSLENNGSTILVSADKVYDMRIKIAGEGGLTGQGIGFEVFDEVKVGQTEFVQKINYQRALQGELSRTITEFPAVESARVHLVIPQKSLFIEEELPPSASVVLTLAEGQKMSNKDVTAIVNLMTMSVEGLEKGRVSIADTKGTVLYHPEDETSIEGMTSTQFDHKQTIQRNLEMRIQELLYPIIGAGKVIAKVNADLDFNQRTIRKELYDPDSAVIRSEQKSEETTRGTANLEAGTPDANFRGDGVGGSISQQDSTRETSTLNYEINKEEQNIITPVGQVDRLSIAVVVDGMYAANAETGEMVFTPRTEEEMTRIKELVSNAVGFETARGDAIEVSCIAFGELNVERERSLAEVIGDYAMRMGKPILNAVLVFLFLLLIVRPVILALIRPKVEAGEVMEGLEGLPMGEERIALIEGEEEIDALDALKKIEDIKAHALQISEQNMEQAVGILKSWLKDTGGQKVGHSA
ncbi:flagellar basal-body MS-ring/collar protein FliF [Halodesulfovibrio sp. MK-HDV]|uniref:flagellar basal-body MS-ring/collar protein FliF n=1 Tax=unclassified Halodesulfovibrio TaxID=2644657 RepID=UPI0013705FC1|nr:flagellar basal-body MS-ring/collar protein FliF [Halodesulfovibrio sp. MK-HDV]KAF1076122.1 Flagellar M-ring protein [Halodesulfovibrio sp. MK-HDV]